MSYNDVLRAASAAVSAEMLERIQFELDEIERLHDVKILYAAESGSRAWGFPSPDSDYDVRFIYAHKKDWYLKLEQTSDVIEIPVTEILDINGWDIQKMLKLLRASNPTLFEWCRSPVVYRTTEYFESLRPLIDTYFQAKPGLYHYLNMGLANYRQYMKGDMVRGKKYFYVLRPVLACRWILERNCPPPMEFEALAKDQLPEELMSVVNELLAWKRSTVEAGEIPKIDVLNQFMEAEFERMKPVIDGLPRREAPRWEPLNELFSQAIDVI